MTFLSGGDRTEVSLTGTRYADAHISAGGAITVDTLNEWHAVTGFASDDVSGITFNAGSTGAITVYANPGGGQVTVTSAGHGLSDGDIVTIAGSTNYNGIFEISNVVAPNTFEITALWAGDDAAGTWRNGSNCVLLVDGIYLFTWQISAQSVGVNKIFSFTISLDVTIEINGLQKRKFATGGDVGSVSGSFLINGVAGDIIAFNLRNETDATNITIEDATMNLIKIA